MMRTRFGWIAVAVAVSLAVVGGQSRTTLDV